MDRMEYIDSKTGFLQGQRFRTVEEVREYFTISNINHMFGMGECDMDQEELDQMADEVILNRWHCVEG